MEDLNQVVIQLTTAPHVRALAQYGVDQMPSNQVEIIYDNLSAEEKEIFDAFIDMIKTK